MEVKSILFLLGYGLGLSACATPYQAEGFLGGYSEIPLSADVYKIHVNANEDSSPATSNAIAFIRAAELSIKNGYDRFVVLDTSQYSRSYKQLVIPGKSTSHTNTTGTVNTYGYGGHVNANSRTNTTYTPPVYANYSKPRTDLTVKFIRTSDADSELALVSTDIIKQFAPVLGLKVEGCNPADLVQVVKQDKLKNADNCAVQAINQVVTDK